MKHILFAILIIFVSITLNAQNSKQYSFNLDAGDSIKNFTVNLPATWLITNETKGTPYTIIGFELTDKETYQLNNCSPDMRIGIRIFRNTLDETLGLLGFNKSGDNSYLFTDSDGYINLVIAWDFSIEKIKGMNFTIQKLINCPTNDDDKKRKKKRQTVAKMYVCFSYQNTTVCMESFNGEFGEETFNLLKKTFKINT